VSTRVEGADPPVIMITAEATLAAGTACLMLTVTEESGHLWRYNLSEKTTAASPTARSSFPAIWPPCAAPRRAAQICAAGYQPGTIERGLLDTFAQDTS
jgi:hypothetical protein